MTPHRPDPEVSYACLVVVLMAIVVAIMSGCVPSSQPIGESVQSLSIFRIAAAHVATIRPKLPDTLEDRDEPDEVGGQAGVDDRPLCVLYRERWMAIEDSDEIDGYRVIQKDPESIPDAIRKRGFRLPIVHWDAGNGAYRCAEYRGASEFMRVHRLPVREQITIRGSSPHWTHPGDIYDHLRTTHGADASGLTREQALSLHDALHEGRATVNQACPGGRCPRVRMR